MLAGDVKKGQFVLLTDGVLAEVMDNKRGISRCIKFQGRFGPSMGDAYIFQWYRLSNADGDALEPIEFSPEQKKRRQAIRAAGFL